MEKQSENLYSTPAQRKQVLELEKTSALKLLSYLSEETRLLIYRDLNRAREERFVGKLEDLSGTDKARLKLLEAIKKEQCEQPKKPVRRWD